MPSVQVANEIFEPPIPPEGSLNAHSGLTSLTQVSHELLSLPFGAESLLNAHHNRSELASVAHQLLLPALELDPFEDPLLDDGACSESPSGIVPRKFAPQGCLNPCRFQVSQLVQRGFDGVPGLVLYEKFCHATLPGLIVTHGQDSGDLGVFSVQPGRFVEDVANDGMVDLIEDALADKGPENVPKVIIVYTVAVANLTNFDGGEHAASAQLLHHDLVIEGFHVGC
mmetsp:Transcript_2771/g.3809  ORF Transcript_2771/g.3809 Transcript_2771/m.3809 type:complete len:226 (-) Transcript_2771:1850-2527(-)